MLVGVVLDDVMGQVEIPDREILCFPGGIPGFDHLTRYVLISLEPPLFLLQAVDDPHVGFVLLDPFLLDCHYRVDLPEEDRTLLELERGEQPALLSIVTLSPWGMPRTANLRAPIALNPSRRLGVQVILLESGYAVRHPIPVRRDGSLAVRDRQRPSGRAEGPPQGALCRVGSR